MTSFPNAEIESIETMRLKYYGRIEKETKIQGPHGWIQWKGTDVCIDLHCDCGHLGHIDDTYCYHYRCSKCKKEYTISAYVKLIPVTEEESEHIKKNECDFREEMTED